jgi:hypothetical protein
VIQLPERAVTRFLVPFIDVLILLFCIFLLLPFVSSPAESKTAADNPADLEALREKLKKTEDELAVERKRVDNWVKNPAASAQRTAVWVIDVDGDTGELSYAAPDGPPGKRFYLTRETVTAYIELTRTRSRPQAVKYLFVCPRKPSRFPDKATLDNIKAWFASESYTIDNPFAPR